MFVHRRSRFSGRESEGACGDEIRNVQSRWQRPLLLATRPHQRRWPRHQNVTVSTWRRLRLNHFRWTTCVRTYFVGCDKILDGCAHCIRNTNVRFSNVCRSSWSTSLRCLHRAIKPKRIKLLLPCIGHYRYLFSLAVVFDRPKKCGYRTPYRPTRKVCVYR